jgi:uncharacterized membrane protein
MSRQVRWLWGQSTEWVDKGLISREQAGRIRALYPEPKTALPWGTIIFSGLGAGIAGLGVILLLAYNWQAIPKAAKLAIIFLGLAGLHAGGIRLCLQGERWRQVGEALCVLGTMFFGAGIWLVAQIYHINEHFPNGFLIWGLGALALAWAMPSLAQALLATAVLCIWGCSEGWGFGTAIHWAPLFLLASLGSLAWRLRSPLLLCFVLTAFAATLCANVHVVEGALLLRVLLSFAALFVAVAILCSRQRWFPESAAVWGFFGWLGFLLCLYLLTFPEIVEDLLGLEWRHQGTARWAPMQLVYGWGPLVLALLAWGGVAWPWRPGAPREARPQDCEFHYWLIPLTAILCQALAMTRLPGEKWEVASVFNLVFLALAVAWMARGCRQGLLRPTILGSLLLVALTAARYFDLFDSLALRGLVFLAIGGLLIGEGFLFRRARRRVEAAEEVKP